MAEANEELLRKEIAYYKKQLEILSGKNIRNELVVTGLNHAVKQKNDVLAVLSVLQQKYTINTPLEQLFEETVKAISLNLGMNRVVALLPDQESDLFKPVHQYGFTADFFSADNGIFLPAEFQEQGHFQVINRKSIPGEIALRIQELTGVKFFVALPLVHEKKALAYIIAGRIVERPPFSPVLDKGDVDSLSAIVSQIRTLLQNKKSIELELKKAEVEKENVIITEQRNQLEKTLAELKSTQMQLIQKEKMASLGELTAGIAHEIQNPLNFVNNFSEVSVELINEAIGNRQKAIGNSRDASNNNSSEIKEMDDLLADIKQNLEKINHHGKRADTIVKGMLQHSRSTTGNRELTDVNELVDEYIKLAFHAFRGKENTFDVNLQTDFDPSIGAIELAPQEIGRVLLNILNNAFYAVNGKKKEMGNGYEPVISVSTKKNSDTIELHVVDNGGGIPEKLVDKVFQPFFTTKPTGSGTGLGLSLSYDIIKAHGGEIKVQTMVGEGAEFIISLPIN